MKDVKQIEPHAVTYVVMESEKEWTCNRLTRSLLINDEEAHGESGLFKRTCKNTHSGWMDGTRMRSKRRVFG